MTMLSFKAKVSDMELRLGAMVCQAFDECSNCESAFKVSTQSKCCSNILFSLC